MSGAEFLFVRENPIYSGSKRHEKLVNRHVQLSTTLKRRRVLAPSAAPCGWSSLPRKDGEPEHADPGYHALEQSSSHIGARMITPRSTKAEALFHFTSLAAAMMDRGLCVPISVPHKLEPWKSIVLEYFIIYWTTKPSTTDHQRDFLVRKAITDRVQACLTLDVHMYALASAVSAHMRSITRTTAVSVKGIQTSPEAFLQCAYRGLRAYFTSLKEGDNIDPQILVDMMDLFRTEFFARRINAGRFHVWIYDSLVDRVVEEQCPRPPCQQSWNLCAVIQALYNHSERLLTMKPEDVYREQIPVSELDTPHSSKRIGVGFDAVTNLFNSEMRSSIQETVSWARKTRASWSDLSSDDLVEGEDIIYRLAWVPTPPSTVLFSEEQALILLGYKVPCVRIALILWLSLATCHPSLQEASGVLLPRLQNHLTMIIENDRNQIVKCTVSEQELFFWVSSVGIESAMKVKGEVLVLFELQKYFAQASAARLIGSVAELLEKFLPLPAAHNLTHLGTKISRDDEIPMVDHTSRISVREAAGPRNAGELAQDAAKLKRRLLSSLTLPVCEAHLTST